MLFLYFDASCRCTKLKLPDLRQDVHCRIWTSIQNAGSGYLAACLGIMVSPNGHVLGIEQHEPLAQRSIASMKCVTFLLLAQALRSVLL